MASSPCLSRRIFNFVLARQLPNRDIKFPLGVLSLSFVIDEDNWCILFPVSLLPVFKDVYIA